MSMKDVRVGRTSLAERMNIFEVVIESNHFLIQPQTAGKNEGAPMIWRENQYVRTCSRERRDSILKR